MKSMNDYESKRVGLKERVARAVGDRLAKMATEPRGCWLLHIYEPEVPAEMIIEMSESQT